MLIHDTIKILYTKLGFLPNYPYHLISDEEMCRAFIDCIIISEDERPKFTGFFYYYYTRMTGVFGSLWYRLAYSLYYYTCLLADEQQVPDWVYTYMLGRVVCEKSDTLDKHDLFVSLNADNIDDTFTEEQYNACFYASSKWIIGTHASESQYSASGSGNGEHIITEDDLKIKGVSKLFKLGDMVQLRPTTVFGEPHVIKYARLQNTSMK